MDYLCNVCKSFRYLYSYLFFTRPRFDFNELMKMTVGFLKRVTCRKNFHKLSRIFSAILSCLAFSFLSDCVHSLFFILVPMLSRYFFLLFSRNLSFSFTHKNSYCMFDEIYSPLVGFTNIPQILQLTDDRLIHQLKKKFCNQFSLKIERFNCHRRERVFVKQKQKKKIFACNVLQLFLSFFCCKINF